MVTFIFVALPFLFFLLFIDLGSLQRGDIIPDLLASLARLVTAYIISAILAWLLGVAFSWGRRSEVALPVFDVLQSFPTFAMLPLATLFFGTGNTTIVFFLVITIIWPMLFSVISSLKLVKRDWQEVTQIYNIRGLLYMRKFIWPLSLPGMVTGSIIGLGEGWEAMVATEIIAHSRVGLGNFFERYSAHPAITMFGIFGLLLLIFSFNRLIWLPLLNRSHKLMEE